jgi:hypothetical protein
LTDQHGRTITRANLRDKVVLLTLTFLDPVSTSDCPEAWEFRETGQPIISAGLEAWFALTEAT